MDQYFKRPLFYDYGLSLLICLFVYYLSCNQRLIIPNIDDIKSSTTDLSTIGLTLAGFILTLLTVLVTFKVGSKVIEDEHESEAGVFDLFFKSRLYYETIHLLKNGIKSLMFVSLIGFFVKLIGSSQLILCLYYWNLGSLIIISMTLLRSLLILDRILHLQKVS